ncbi:hypothetical protein C8R46DRAFT_1049220 [Mycena filopes]|nr:hypothetical protein C8R46DRAFT_1049220 [Mycena filopes]
MWYSTSFQRLADATFTDDAFSSGLILSAHRRIDTYPTPRALHVVPLISNTLTFEHIQRSRWLRLDAPSSLAAFRQIPVQPPLTSFTYYLPFDGGFNFNSAQSTFLACWGYQHVSVTFRPLGTAIMLVWIEVQQPLAVVDRPFVVSGFKFNVIPVLHFHRRSSRWIPNPWPFGFSFSTQSLALHTAVGVSRDRKYLLSPESFNVQLLFNSTSVMDFKEYVVLSYVPALGLVTSRLTQFKFNLTSDSTQVLKVSSTHSNNSGFSFIRPAQASRLAAIHSLIHPTPPSSNSNSIQPNADFLGISESHKFQSHLVQKLQLSLRKTAS